MSNKMQLKSIEISPGVTLEQFESRTKETYHRIVKPQVEAQQSQTFLMEKVKLTAAQKALADCHSPY